MHHMREGLTKARNKKKKTMQTAREHPGGLFMSKHTKTFRHKKFSFLFFFGILYVKENKFPFWPVTMIVMRMNRGCQPRAITESHFSKNKLFCILYM